MSDALRLADALEQGTYLLSVERGATAAELRRLHAEHIELGKALARAIERNNELEAELAEQARLVGMGSEREARLVALNAELVEALREISDDYADRFDLDSPSTNPGIKFTIKQARAALAKAGVSK